MSLYFGLKNRWTTYIHDYDPPHRFTDIQLKGPNSYWHHTHEFKQTKEGTLIIDNIRFLLPLGWVGKLGYHLVMKHIVKSLFNYRTRVIQSEFTFLSEKNPSNHDHPIISHSWQSTRHTVSYSIHHKTSYLYV